MNIRTKKKKINNKKEKYGPHMGKQGKIHGQIYGPVHNVLRRIPISEEQNSGVPPGRKTPLLQKVHKWITNFGEVPGRLTTLLQNLINQRVYNLLTNEKRVTP